MCKPVIHLHLFHTFEEKFLALLTVCITFLVAGINNARPTQWKEERLSLDSQCEGTQSIVVEKAC